MSPSCCSLPFFSHFTKNFASTLSVSGSAIVNSVVSSHSGSSPIPTLVV